MDKLDNFIEMVKVSLSEIQKEQAIIVDVLDITNKDMNAQIALTSGLRDAIDNINARLTRIEKKIN